LSKKKSLKQSAGQMLVEMAISILMLMILIIGTVELGIAIYQKIAMTSAAHEAVRVAALQLDSAPNDAQVKAVAQQLASFLPLQNIAVNRAVTVYKAQDAVRVDVTYYHKYTVPIIGTGVTLSAMSIMRKETLTP
jgi:Flp pilus assembly protein TadG